MAKTPDLNEDEMKEILKDLARNSTNAAARIAALKELRQIGANAKPVDGFEGLDEGDELASRRDRSQAA